MMIEGEGGIKDDAKVAYQGGGSDGRGVNSECNGSSFIESGFGANEEEFCFVTV